MTAPAVTRHVSLNLASLPGFGLIEDPKAKHYAAAIRNLEQDYKARPKPYNVTDGYSRVDARIELAYALETTLRRIMWRYGAAET